MALLFFLFGIFPCFSQEENNAEEVEENPKNNIIIGTGIAFFGSFFQKPSLGLGVNVFVLEDPSSADTGFIINNILAFEYFQRGVDLNKYNTDLYEIAEEAVKGMEGNGDIQIRASTQLTYLLFFGIGISGSIYINGQKNIQYGMAPEVYIGIPPFHFLPLSPGILYRYNIYNFNSNSSYNYHEISFSLKMLLPFGKGL
jgi:hypothetical protein